MSGVDSLEGFTRWLKPQMQRNWKVDVEITPDHLLNSHHLQQYVAKLCGWNGHQRLPDRER